MACDIDPVASDSYARNFGIVPRGDIADIASESIPDFDVLCAGFPCQPFSNIGKKGGLEDSRGTLIFHVARILKEKRPRAFILENVRGLQTIDGGKVLSVIISDLESAGYATKYKMLEAKDYGVPQIRKRLFIVGVRDDLDIPFEFPEPIGCDTKLSDVLGGETEREFGFTVRVGGRRSGINNKFNWDCYSVNGTHRYITPEECLVLQGFPKDHFLSGNSSDRYRQVGNAVPTTVVREIGKVMVRCNIVSGRPQL